MTYEDGQPLKPAGRLRFPVPAYVPMLGIDSLQEGAAEMAKVKTYGREMPRGEARPLGTSRKEFSATRKISLDSVGSIGVDCQKMNEAAIPPPSSEMKQKETHMTLTFKNLSKNGKNAFYTGAKSPIRFPLSSFPDKQHPETIEVADGTFAAASTPKAKLTKEERAALPKPTLAERIAKREAQLAKDKAKLEAQSAGM